MSREIAKHEKGRGFDPPLHPSPLRYLGRHTSSIIHRLIELDVKTSCEGTQRILVMTPGRPKQRNILQIFKYKTCIGCCGYLMKLEKLSSQVLSL